MTHWGRSRLSSWGGYAILLLSLVHSDLAFAKKDFKGLLGNFRRERFTENPGNSTDFGFDLMLSTMLPITSVVNSTEDRAVSLGPMAQSTFFNVEASFFLTLAYNFELFANIGYYNFETRKENGVRVDSSLPFELSNPMLPRFHQFEMEAEPLIFGIRYRFSTDDIVPYVGIGVGGARVRRKASYDYSTASDEEISTVMAGEVIVGLEFFFSSSMGIRLETSAFYFRLPERTFDPSGPAGNAALFPIFSMQGNPWLLRYASGLFLIF